MPFKSGDEILIKVIGGESPNKIVVMKIYGDIIFEEAKKEIYCSFCSAQASKEMQPLAKTPIFVMIA